MINTLLKNKLFQLTLLSSLLIILRALLVSDGGYYFLFWNIFLALLPNIILLLNKYFKNKAILIPWFLFFPNTIYLLTDFKHINISDGSIYWLDLIMMASVSILGFTASLDSLKKAYKTLFGDKDYQPVIIYLTILITCLGIFMGREIRLNTWDLVNPVNFYNLVSSYEFNINTFLIFVLIWPIFLTWLFFIFLNKNEISSNPS